MSYQARCHCGAVQVEIEGDLPDKAIECNCSHCTAKGLLLTAVARDQLKVAAGEESLRPYKFNTHVISHQFCSVCGTQPFAEGVGPDGSPMAMVNLRCVADADLDAMARMPFDGASL